jgi:hypothetical protein
MVLRQRHDGLHRIATVSFLPDAIYSGIHSGKRKSEKMAFEIPKIPTHRRLTLALLLSLLVHALLLSLTFGGQGAGIPGFGLPWQERRFEVPDLRVVLVPANTPPPSRTLIGEPLQQTTIKPPAADGLPLKPRDSRPVTPAPTQVAAEVQAGFSVNAPPVQTSIAQPVADEATLKPPLVPSKIPAPTPAQTAEAISPKPARLEPTAPAARSEPAATTEVVAVIAPPLIPAPAVIAVERAELATFAVPPLAPPPPTPTPTPAPAPVIAAAPSTSSPERVSPTAQADADATKQEATKLEAARQDAARTETARLEAQRQQDARLAAAKLEAQLEAKLEVQRQADKVEAARVEAAGVESAKVESAKVESAKAESAKVETAKLEATRQEAARVESARIETQRQEAARLAAAQLEAQRSEIARQGAARELATREAAREAARLDTERQEGVRQHAARLEAARALAEKEEDAKREARRQAMGRTLNEEAAQREAAEAAARSPSSSSKLPYSLSTARRARLWGRTNPNVELVLYAEAWARKIESNTLVDTVREVAKRPHTDPMLTVAIRSDGSVESVTFVLSSGVAEVDEAIRQIVQSHVPYRAFPPALARDVDVIEVRRTWHFDIGIRLY